MQILGNRYELFVAGCTLVFLFNLQQAGPSGRGGVAQHRRREISLGFLSLAFTVAVLVMVVGTDKLTRGAQTACRRVRSTPVGRLSVA